MNRLLAACGCTPIRSIRKLSADRLPASRSNTGCCSAAAGPAAISVSTSSRMRSTACVAGSSPSTDSTPRMACNWAGTGISSVGSCGARKNWSISFSDSPRLPRSSCTTLPIVCRSATRRYSSSIQASSGCGRAPLRTASMRLARRRTRAPCSGPSKSPSASTASSHSRLVAHSIASVGAGAACCSTVVAPACASASASVSPEGSSRLSDSPTSANCSFRPERRCISPPATADQASLAPATRLAA